MAYSYMNMLIGICLDVKTCLMAKKSPVKLDLEVVGRRIRLLRGKERQDDFAPLIGITQGQLSKIERGLLAPSAEVLVRLRDRTGKSVDWILQGEG